jgi:assimilatory nitrate reductase catalytic subunit
MGETRTTCAYCGVGCGILVSEKGEVRGDPDHPANRGRLCSKGTALAETLDDSRRLRRPRLFGKDSSWDVALDVVAESFRNTIAEYGPDSVAFYVSGQLLTEDYYVANKLMKGFIGGANIDTNSRLCMASAVAGHVRAFGEDVVPVVYEDMDEADLVVLVGSNTAWCHPILYQRLVDARAKRGTRVVNIDPRRTATSEIADLHLSLAPGSDVLLFNGLLAYLRQNGHINQAWVGAHTSGFAEALKTAEAEADTVAMVAKGTRLSPWDVEAFFKMFAETERTVTAFSQGVNQSSAGTDKVNAIINCHLATGRIGKPGMGPFSITGQPNAMGGREVGGFANQVAVHVGFDNAAEIERIAAFWSAPNIAARPGLKAIEMFEAIHDGRIKAVWIMATNPVDSLPRGNLVREALGKCPLVVVSDCWDTDTTAFAQVVFPAAGWSEKDGTVTNAERCISRQRPFRAPPGHAKPDWWIIAEVARRMGWGEAFPYQWPADIFREYAALSSHMNEGKRLFNIAGLADVSDDEYELMQPVRWPVKDATRQGTDRIFAEGGFTGHDDRAHFVATAWLPLASADRQFAYLLNTGRIRDQWHTMTRTGHVQRLMTHQDEPFLDIHPDDAGKVGVEDGGLVRIETAHGNATLRARLSASQRRGEVFAPMHWTDQFSAAGPINRLVTAARDPFSGQPDLKATRARLAPVPTLWRGLVVRHDAAMPHGPFYAARTPAAAGQFFELRGWDPLPREAAVDIWVADLLAEGANARRIEIRDEGRGIYRFAVTVGGRLQACVFLSRDADGLPQERDKFVDLLGLPTDEEDLLALLAIPAAGQKKRALGPIVCACNSVRAAAIRDAICDKGLRTPAEIGAACGAGTSCGSCLPELSRMLREEALALA